MVKVSVLQSWTCLNAALVGLNYFNFGLINYNYGEFGGLLALVEDLHQKVLCFAAKVATCLQCSRSMVEVSAFWS